MKTSEYQRLLDRTPELLHALAEEAYCVGYTTRLRCERAIKETERCYPDEVYDQNDMAILDEALYGGWETEKQGLLLSEKHAKEDPQTYFSPSKWILAAKQVQAERDAEEAFLVRQKSNGG
jgi:hypothetical protein